MTATAATYALLSDLVKCYYDQNAGQQRTDDEARLYFQEHYAVRTHAMLSTLEQATGDTTVPDPITAVINSVAMFSANHRVGLAWWLIDHAVTTYGTHVKQSYKTGSASALNTLLATMHSWLPTQTAVDDELVKKNGWYKDPYNLLTRLIELYGVSSDLQGYTPLHTLVTNNRLVLTVGAFLDEFIRPLIDAGCKTDTRTAFTHTAHELFIITLSAMYCDPLNHLGAGCCNTLFDNYTTAKYYRENADRINSGSIGNTLPPAPTVPLT